MCNCTKPHQGIACFIGMVKEILYRRSFHCDRDLKSVKNMLELEKAVVGRKANGDGRMLADGGFEAPRNSLDVPFGGFTEMRRHSEVRCEDIPIGYELSRSLTTRRRNEDSLVRKSMSSADSFLSKSKVLDNGNPEADQKPRASSVVARLMGLDPLPHQDDLQSLQSSSHPSSRILLPHEFFTPQSGHCTTNKQASISRVPSQRGTTFIEESIPERPRSYAELPFRNHPQEKQLQEFKKEFTVRQGKQSEPCSKVDMLGMHEKVLQKEKQGFGRETLQESQEFLDALDFLNSNKEFFVKVLKDPSSLFAKNLQHRGVSSVHKEGLGQKGSRLTRSFSESRKESYICLPVAQDLTHSRRKHEMNRYESDDKAQSVCIPPFEQDEHMPLQSRRHTRSISPPLKTGYDQTMPTKIVVLKPKLGKHARNRSSSPLSPLSRLDASFKASEDGKESAKHDIKERLLGRNEQAAAKEPSGNFSKDGLKDVGDIARQIVKQVKEDMSRRLSSENSQSLESTSLARSSSRGRRLPAEKIGAFADTTGASDGEGYCSSSRRITRDNVKANVSLPSSPRLARTDSENEYRPFAGNRRKGVSGEKSSRVSTSANNSRDTRKDHVGVGGFLDVGRDLKSLTNTRAGGSKDGKGTSESPKILPRSLSAPASAATVENRALEHKQKGRLSVDRSASLNNARAAENSLFKGKLLSLKDSFSLNKKRSSKKQTHNSPSESSELSSPRQLTEELEGVTGVDVQESCIDMSPVYSWQTTCSTQDDKDKAVMEECLDYLMSVNSVDSSGQHQWTSTGDLLDSASDVSLEKCEQPSPVSVLDPPFQEESPSPEQTISECHEASLKFSPLDSDYKKRLLDLHEALLSSSASRQSSFNSIAEEALSECNGANLPLETLSMGDIACPLGAEEELLYIRDLLASAGFTNNELVTRAHAFSVEHGLNPSIFARLESHYEKMSKRKTSSRHNGCSTPLNALSRRILYDVIDEILSRKLIEPTFQLGLRQAKPFVPFLYAGKQLLEQVWANISYYRYVPCDCEEDGLDSLASRELMTDAGWLHSPSDMQAVATELERLICGDLIREVVHEYVRGKAMMLHSMST